MQCCCPFIRLLIGAFAVDPIELLLRGLVFGTIALEVGGDGQMHLSALREESRHTAGSKSTYVPMWLT